MAEENSYTDDDLNRIREKAFNPELKGLISKVTGRPKPSTAPDDLKKELYSLFYSGLAASCPGNSYLSAEEFNFFNGKNTDITIISYDYSNLAYRTDKGSVFNMDTDFFLKIKTGNAFTTELEGNRQHIIPFRSFTDAAENDLFPPFIISPSRNIGFIEAVAKYSKNNPPEITDLSTETLINILLELSAHYSRLFLVQCASSRDNNHFFDISRLRNLVRTASLSSEIFAVSPVKAVLLTTADEENSALNAANTGSDISWRHIVNIRNEYFSIFNL